MEPELARILQYSSREQLILLLHQLAARHPALLPEIMQLLGLEESHASKTEAVDDHTIDDEVTENWDFSGDEVDNYSSLPTIFAPLEREGVQQRITHYSARLEQGEALQTVRLDIAGLFKEAEERAEYHDYHGALDLYALLLDACLHTPEGDLAVLFTNALDNAIPALEAFLTEVSSTLQTDATFSPLLTTENRHRWIEQLFALWLKWVEAHRAVEHISDMLYTIVWNEDAMFLNHLIQQELQQQCADERENIVDFTRQYRVRALERLQRGLPLP